MSVAPPVLEAPPPVEDLTRLVRSIVNRYEARALRAGLEASDLSQEALLRVWRALPRYDPRKGTVGTYVGIITEHAVWDMLRSQRRWREWALLREAGGGPDGIDVEAPPAEEDGLERREEMQQAKRMAEALLARLQPRLRQAVEMRFGLADGREHTLEEIGAALGVSGERARQILEKALQQLRHQPPEHGDL